MLIPSSESSFIVLVLGSNKPAIRLPASFFKLVTISTFVSPSLSDNFAAIFDIRPTGVVLASTYNARLRLPFFSRFLMTGWTGTSRPFTSFAGNSNSGATLYSIPVSSKVVTSTSSVNEASLACPLF